MKRVRISSIPCREQRKCGCDIPKWNGLAEMLSPSPLAPSLPSASKLISGDLETKCKINTPRQRLGTYVAKNIEILGKPVAYVVREKSRQHREDRKLCGYRLFFCRVNFGGRELRIQPLQIGLTEHILGQVTSHKTLLLPCYLVNSFKQYFVIFCF